VDCTFRDGGHLNKWDFPGVLVGDTYTASSRAGIDIFEMGYRVAPSMEGYARLGPWAKCTDEFLRQEFGDKPSGVPLAVMVDAGRVRLEDIGPRRDSPVSMIRIATYFKTLEQAIDLVSAVSERGYETSLNLMAIGRYSPAELEEAKGRLAAAKVRRIYCADSFGSFFPEKVKFLIAQLREIGNVEVGFHAHNNLQMAFANTLAALEAGAGWIDATVYGMGRGVGNLPLEILVAYLQDRQPDRYNVIPLLEVIARHFTPLQKSLGWGYGLAGLMSAAFDVHPTYASKMLERKDLLVEDIWNLLREVQAGEKESGFSADILCRVLSSGKFLENRHELQQRLAVSIGHHHMADFARSDAGDHTPNVAVFKGRHLQRPVLIFAGGPSVKEYLPQLKRFIEKYQPFTIGSNNIVELLDPDYYLFTNKLRFAQYAKQVNLSRSRLMVAGFFEPSFIYEHVIGPWDFVPIRLGTAVEAPFVTNEVIQVRYLDVSIVAIGVATLMGASQVYVAGLDGFKPGMDAGSFHFYRETAQPEDTALLAERHRNVSTELERVSAYLKKQNLEFSLITPTSHHQYYRGIERLLDLP
jgi:4-hydroxy 2-oxovalerate aldolase